MCSSESAGSITKMLKVIRRYFTVFLCNLLGRNFELLMYKFYLKREMVEKRILLFTLCESCSMYGSHMAISISKSLFLTDPISGSDLGSGPEKLETNRKAKSLLIINDAESPRKWQRGYFINRLAFGTTSGC